MWRKISNYHSKCFTHHIRFALNEALGHEIVNVGSKKLQSVMKDVYLSCKNTAEKYNVTLTDGANILSFLKIIDGMTQLGYIW